MSSTPQHKRPLRFGAVAAVFAAPLAYSLLEVVSAGSALGVVLYVPMAMMLGLFITGPAMLILGVPWVWLLRERRWLNYINVCIGASIAGVVAMAATVLAVGGSLDMGAVVIGSLSGLVSGVAFCLASGVRVWRLRY